MSQWLFLISQIKFHTSSEGGKEDFRYAQREQIYRAVEATSLTFTNLGKNLPVGK